LARSSSGRAQISWKQLSDELGGLPPIKYHCSILAVGALKRAIRAYCRAKGERPEWLRAHTKCLGPENSLNPHEFHACGFEPYECTFTVRH
jgi:hypothetical protein